MPQSLMKVTFGCEAFTSCCMLIEGHFFVHPLRDAHLLQDNLCTVEAQDENLSCPSSVPWGLSCSVAYLLFAPSLC